MNRQGDTPDLDVYQKYFTLSSDMICIADLDGYFQDINPSFENTLGYTREEVRQVRFLDLVHPDDLESTLNEVAALKLHAGSPHFTNRYRSKKGSYRWLTWHLQPTGGAGLVYASARDVTDRVKTQEELRRSEEKFRLLAENMADVVILHQPDSTIDYVSPSVERILGYTPEELIGTNPYTFLVYPKDVAKVRDGIHQEMLTAQSQPRTVEFRVCRKDGSYVWFESTFKAVKNQHHQVTAIVTASRDVSDRKKEEERSRQFERRLLESNEELESFAYIASHDLQEPLRMISSYLQVLQRRYHGQLDDQAEQFIHYAVDGASRMKRLINDLLMYSQVNSLLQDKQPVDLYAVVTQIQEDLQLLIRETNTTVHCQALPTLYVNETLMYRIFLNLIGNAIKFRSDCAPLINISVEKQKDIWQFSISDNGVGIEEAYIETIFDVFTRLNGHKYEGTGIGLSIVKKIIENYQGTTSVSSQVGKGTTFYFTLPQSA